jgi:polysaccharide transporter, PST family
MPLKKYFDKVKSRPDLQVILTNISWLFFDKVLRMGVGVFITLYIARYLGTSQFGTLNYATAFVAMFFPITTLGLDGASIRYLVNNIYPKEQILCTVLWLKLLGGLIALLMCMCGIYFFRPNDSITISLVAILASVGVIQAFNTIDIWFQSQVQSKYTVIAKNTAFILASVLNIILIQGNFPLITFAIATLLEAVLGAFGLIICFSLQGHTINLSKWSTSLAKNLLLESWPLILSGLSVMMYLKIDQLMLGEMIGDKAVGVYSAAARISEAWYFIPVAISSSTAPSIFAAKKISEELYYTKIKKIIRSMTFISIIVTVPMTLLSGFTISTLFGREYSESGSILAVHIWASIFVFMGTATSTWFIAEGLNALSLQRTLLGAITNIILNLILIPHYQGMGAAIATVISYAISGFFANALNIKTREIFILQLKSLAFR